jgi:biopolymer transport protein ExbD
MEDAARTLPQAEIHLEADARTPCEILARVMALAARSGRGRIGFISESARTP